MFTDMDSFWSLWIILLTSANLFLVLWVLLANRKVAISDEEDPENKTTGHVHDGIEEYDNPLPRWWFMLFLASMIFAILYLLLYPGMGNWKGILGWTSLNELQQNRSEAQKQYQASYGVYSKMPIPELAREPRAMKMAQRIFSNNCAVCHGSDGAGYIGYPNLTDNDWQWGGSPETIKQTLIYGRQAVMPAWGASIGEQGIARVTQYVLQLSGKPHEVEQATIGEKIFSQNCAVCHGAEGRGMPALGAPNLTDNIWLYGGSAKEIRASLRNGRNGVMPAQKDRLREDKIHLLAAYVYYLAGEK